MKQKKHINLIRARRSHRTRTLVRGTAIRPRLSVFRSNTNLYVQLIDDGAAKTLASVSSRETKGKQAKMKKAEHVGEAIAKKAKSLGIEKAVFDRGRYAYHGAVKAIAEAARKTGLTL